MPARPDHATTFRGLHQPGAAFVMPNAWDVGTAVLLGGAGFEAIATTSSGIAYSLGRGDHSLAEWATSVSREAMFERMGEIAAAVDLPVNGDLEDGYGATPEAVAETIQMALAAGLAGGNIEDFTGNGELYEEALSIERIEAARETIDAAGSSFVLTARTDGQQLKSPASLDESIERLNRYREAGADCLYAPGVNDLGQNARIAQEVDGPLNVVIGLGSTGLTVPALREIGVARVSLGGTIARACLGFVRDAARELIESGTIDFAERQFDGRELNDLFAERERIKVR